MSAFGGILSRLQPLGRALMLPIAVLPVAALLLRLGQPDMLDIAFVAAAGSAIFANLGLLFAAGVAVGLARDNHGAAGLAGVVCYLVATEGAKALLVLPPDTLETAAEAWRAGEITKISVPAGILSGLVAGFCFNRFGTIKLPDYLAFFAGRRFVPIVAGMAGLVLAALFGLGFPWFEAAVDQISHWVVGAGSLGLFAYGVLNRLLLVTGLHHIINNLAWFLLGDYNGATGDLKRFFAGDPSAGAFMAGFFPVMMFGLPAACLAMYRTALPERKKAVGGLLLSLALTSFLTGVTEPIEFSFMFLAPMLFVLHAVLTGLSMVIMDLLGVKLGFGFSAGLFDYVLNFGLSTRPLWLIPVGLAYFLIYYFSFSWCIRTFRLKTPGREDQPVDETATATGESVPRGEQFVTALGGAGNLVAVDACTTRLRLRLEDPTRIDEPALRALGARGVLHLAGGGVQVVLGPIADAVAGEMRAAAARDDDAVAVAVAGSAPPPGEVISDEARGLAAAITATLGSEIVQIEQRATRLLVELRSGARIDPEPLLRAGVRGVVQPAEHRLHLILGAHAPAVAAALDRSG